MVIDSAVVESFRLAQRGFFDGDTWPEDIITIALCEGDAETGSCRWGEYEDICSNFKQRGMFLYAAHWLATNYPMGASDETQQSGTAQNQLASKSVGDESVSYAVATPSSMSSAGDNWLLSSSFGQQYARLRKRAGMGALAV